MPTDEELRLISCLGLLVFKVGIMRTLAHEVDVNSHEEKCVGWLVATNLVQVDIGTGRK